MIGTFRFNIKNIIKPIYRCLLRRKQKTSWYFEFLKANNRITSELNVDYSNQIEFALILAPHSDDEWIGCSEVIKTRKCAIINMNMAGNDSVDTHKVRLMEMSEIADTYNIPLETRKDEESSDEFIEKMVKKYNAKEIFVPSFIDWHQEHLKVCSALDQYLSKANEKMIVYMYQVSVPVSLKYVNCAFKLSKNEWSSRWGTFVDNYKTQNDFPFTRFAYHDRINGKAFDSYAAQVFIKLKPDDWRHYFGISQNVNDTVLLNKNLNNIFLIRDISDGIYYKTFS